MHNQIMNEVMTRKPLTAARIRRERRECGLLYKIIRSRLGLTQKQLGDLIGCSQSAIVNRESKKRLYSMIELVDLLDISGMTADEWVALMREIAK